MLAIAIVPAAGRSLRMGEPKLLMPWGAGCMIEAVLANWRASSATQVIVVVHPEDLELAAVCRAAGADVLVAESPPVDMKASVQLGLAHAAERYRPTQSDAWLLAPADMPGLGPATINAVIEGYSPADPRIVAPVYDGRRGHPVLFPWKLASEVEQLGATEGINALLRAHPVCEVPALDSAVLEDLDSRAEYDRLHNRYQRQSRPDSQ